MPSSIEWNLSACTGGDYLVKFVLVGAGVSSLFCRIYWLHRSDADCNLDCVMVVMVSYIVCSGAYTSYSDSHLDCVVMHDGGSGLPVSKYPAL